MNAYRESEPEKLEDRLSRIDSEIAGLLTRAVEGGELDFDDGLKLARTEGAERDALVLAADHVRHKRVGDVITYVVNRNINFTNVCFVGCRFCAFSPLPREQVAYFLSLEYVAHRSVEARERGPRAGYV